MVRALEWRAHRFSDPADRLQFLRRNLDQRPASKIRTRSVRWATIVALILPVLLAAIWFWISSKHVTVAVADTRPPSVLKIAPSPPANLAPAPAGPVPAGKVWLVQTTPQFDLYSNGLRVEQQYAATTEPRRYVVFPTGSAPSALSAEWRTEPAGIVYHTTESHLAPFEEDQNQSLRRAGEGMLEYVSRRRSYHFVIDRFGRVFQIVREGDYANHAGNSVWADATRIYINLNQSFFGVAFEASSQPTGTEPAVNTAQVYAGRILTQMLRARYDLPASNCVTHAQVSISPVNHAVGYHRDWAANLPFAELGLADNYKLPPPSVQLFGFEADAGLTGRGASSIAEGLELAADQVRRDAAAHSLPVERYRENLWKRYRDAIRAQRGKSAHQE